MELFRQTNVVFVKTSTMIAAGFFTSKAQINHFLLIFICDSHSLVQHHCCGV